MEVIVDVTWNLITLSFTNVPKIIEDLNGLFQLVIVIQILLASFSYTSCQPSLYKKYWIRRNLKYSKPNDGVHSLANWSIGETLPW